MKKNKFISIIIMNLVFAGTLKAAEEAEAEGKRTIVSGMLEGKQEDLSDVSLRSRRAGSVKTRGTAVTLSGVEQEELKSMFLELCNARAYTAAYGAMLLGGEGFRVFFGGVNLADPKSEDIIREMRTPSGFHKAIKDGISSLKKQNEEAVREVELLSGELEELEARSITAVKEAERKKEEAEIALRRLKHEYASLEKELEQRVEERAKELEAERASRAAGRRAMARGGAEALRSTDGFNSPLTKTQRRRILDAKSSKGPAMLASAGGARRGKPTGSAAAMVAALKGKEEGIS